jgi:hypothetical protein
MEGILGCANFNPNGCNAKESMCSWVTGAADICNPYVNACCALYASFARARNSRHRGPRNTFLVLLHGADGEPAQAFEVRLQVSIFPIK